MKTIPPFTSVPYQQVTIQGGFWGNWQEINRTVTIPAIYQQLKQTGQIDALSLNWKPGMPNPPHIFWDSDVAKWVEAASYSLALHPDPALEAQIDSIVETIARGQTPEGYFNSHYLTVEPQNRWTNLRDNHELYCAGHLIEAAVAHFRATGKRKFLEVMMRYADYIGTVFGRGEGQKRGYPGHEEIELALVKLYHATGEKRYLDLSLYFVDERGSQPHYYDLEAIARGEDPASYWAKTYEYCQAHKPVREQHTAVGHAVRAMYLYSAMADLAAETGDTALLQACCKLFDSVTLRRMYLTGGIGPSAGNEGFTFDYDLPNETAYAETCASIGLILFARRMLRFGCDRRYADAIERALYNGVLSALSQDGTRFFYVNPLAVHRNGEFTNSFRGQGFYDARRKEWYACACCPPNIARLLASLGEYVYSEGSQEVAVHLYMSSRARLHVAGTDVILQQETDYPWDGRVKLTVTPARAVLFCLRLRIPGWCRRAKVQINGEDTPLEIESGYAHLERTWKAGDEVLLTLEMPVDRVYPHPRIRENQEAVAICRGPLIYCLEGVDNGEHLYQIRLPRQADFEIAYEKDLLGGIVTVQADAVRLDESDWEDTLYRFQPSQTQPHRLKAVPYYAWGNRAEGDMLVWLREG